MNYFALSRNQTLAQGRARYKTTVNKHVAAYNCIQSTPNRPLVWIDDEVKFYAELVKWMDRSRVKTTRPNTLLVDCKTDEDYGLTDVDIDRINNFLRKQST